MYSDQHVTEILQTKPATRDRIGEPEVFSKNRKKREIESTWEIGPGYEWPNEERKGDGGTIRLSLRTFHYGDSKRLSTTLRVELAGERFVQTRISFGTGGEAINIYNNNCPRFSAKAMRDHHAHALYLVQECSAAHCAMSLRQGIAAYTERVESVV